MYIFQILVINFKTSFISTWKKFSKEIIWRGAMEIAVFIQNIQEERAEVALYIFLNNSNANFDMSEVLSNNNRWAVMMWVLWWEFWKSSEHDFSLGIQERFSKTDRALEEVPTWPNVRKLEKLFGGKCLFIIVDWQIIDKSKSHSCWYYWSWWIWSFQIKTEVPGSAWSLQVCF